jgi:hypothetical protein
MQSKKFEGRSAEMKKATPWLASEDIMGVAPVKVEVKGCWFHKKVEFDGGRKEDIYAIEFVGKEKQLVLNSTNRQTMVAMFGANVKDWEGHSISLTVVDCKMMGKKVKGIRIVDRTET